MNLIICSNNSSENNHPDSTLSPTQSWVRVVVQIIFPVSHQAVCFWCRFRLGLEGAKAGDTSGYCTVGGEYNAPCTVQPCTRLYSAHRTDLYKAIQRDRTALYKAIQRDRTDLYKAIQRVPYRPVQGYTARTVQTCTRLYSAHRTDLYKAIQRAPYRPVQGYTARNVQTCTGLYSAYRTDLYRAIQRVPYRPVQGYTARTVQTCTRLYSAYRTDLYRAIQRVPYRPVQGYTARTVQTCTGLYSAYRTDLYRAIQRVPYRPVQGYTARTVQTCTRLYSAYRTDLYRAIQRVPYRPVHASGRRRCPALRRVPHWATWCSAAQHWTSPHSAAISATAALRHPSATKTNTGHNLPLGIVNLYGKLLVPEVQIL